MNQHFINIQLMNPIATDITFSILVIHSTRHIIQCSNLIGQLETQPFSP
ncbi:hypothetical protein BN1326_30222 [Staphylococcus argenteus]|uniref:Uncharacterized protein n=1 Tax=Staphylococcus argenteus TaxID=985002 RepID=A0A7U7JSS2_9STAP|nr:hypothetical protein BN1326_30222 [Staphylococcus argenteus]CRI21281.1 hypothetical protein BN1326_30222 [Staphylococcus argenteus]